MIGPRTWIWSLGFRAVDIGNQLLLLSPSSSQPPEMAGSY